MTLAAHAVDRIAYGPEDRIRIGRIAYRCLETDKRGHRLQRVDDPDMFETFDHAEMARIEKSPGYRYDREWFAEGKANSRLRSGVENFSQIPKREQSKVLWKWEYCNRFRLMNARGETDRSNEGMKAAIGKIAQHVQMLDCAKIVRKTNQKRKKGKPVPLNKDGKPRKVRSGTSLDVREIPTYRTLQRWLRILEDCDWTMESLRDGYRHSGNRSPRLDPEEHDLMVEKARTYATKARPTRAQVHDHLDGEIRARNGVRVEQGLPPLRCPSKRRLYAEIASLDKFWVYQKRHTLEAAKRKFAAVEDGVHATRIGERIEMDEWQVGLQTLLIKSRVWKHLDPAHRKAVAKMRPWLYVAIDRASRCVLGMLLSETPLASGAIETIRMVVSDKTRLSNDAGARTPWFMSTGIGTLVTDWGSAYYAEETRRVVAAMGATFDHPPAGMPQLRGTVERFFSTTETRFLSHFAGRTFSNVVQKGDYKPEADANIPFDVLARALVRYVVDDYHHRPHAGLGGETPHDAWVRLRADTGRIPVPDKHTLRHIFGVEHTGVTLDNSGVVVLGLRYQNRDLYDWFTAKGVTKVTVRVDPEDVGFASVRLGDDWITVPCHKKEFQGVPLRVWTEAALDLRRRFQNQASLSRPIVLEAVRDLSALSLEHQREAGIADEPDTPESLKGVVDALGIGFSLPEWDDVDRDAGDGDLLDAVIPVGSAPSTPVDAEPAMPPTPTVIPAKAPTWRMGDRNKADR